METIQLRASSTPRFTKCPGSAFLPQVQNSGAAAELGTAVHKCCEAIVCGQPSQPEKIALLHGVDKDELDSLTWSARALWQEYGAHFPGAVVEHEMEQTDPSRGLSITGHADIISTPGDGTIRIADWKSGWREGDYSAQLKTYALLALNYAEIAGYEPDIERVYVAIFWLRDRSIEGEWYDVATLNDWDEAIAAALDRGRAGELRIGEHCGYCPVAQCPALRDVSLALLDPEREIVTLDDAAVIMLNDFRKAAEKRLEVIKLAVHQYLDANGAIDLDDGRELTLSPTIRETIKPNAEAFEYLLANFTPEELYEMIGMSKTAVLEATRAKAGKGEKKAAAETMMESLRRLGAVQESRSMTIATKKKEIE